MLRDLGYRINWSPPNKEDSNIVSYAKKKMRISRRDSRRNIFFSIFSFIEFCKLPYPAIVNVGRFFS